MNDPRSIIKHRATLDQMWAGLAECVRTSPEQTARLMVILQTKNSQMIRDLPEEDFSLVCTLALLALEEGLLHMASAVQRPAEE